jgi:flagellar P-ring protein FlgI
MKFFTFALVVLFLPDMVFASRIKDISNVRGVRENQLLGYGLVVGLNGTGDGKDEFTSKSFTRMLDTMGMKLDSKDIDSKNVAAVIITATLPPFARAGNKLDVSVNSIGGASNLQGGTLLQTPLKAADQQVYAVAQGSIIIGEKAQPTVGRVPGGALIETDTGADFSNRKMFRLTLFDPDFTTATRVVKTINQDLGGKFASAKDPGTVDVIVPFNYDGNAVEMMANIENLDVSSDTRARVIVNERTGTVVIGEHVQISAVAISHGNLTVQIKVPDPQNSLATATPLTAGSSRPQQQSGDGASNDNVSVRGPASVTGAAGISAGISNVTRAASGGNVPTITKTGRVAIMKKTASVGDLVKALNALGVTPKDLITILQSIKAAGALQGELEVL